MAFAKSSDKSFDKSSAKSSDKLSDKSSDKSFDKSFTTAFFWTLNEDEVVFCTTRQSGRRVPNEYVLHGEVYNLLRKAPDATFMNVIPRSHGTMKFTKTGIIFEGKNFRINLLFENLLEEDEAKLPQTILTVEDVKVFIEKGTLPAPTLRTVKIPVNAVVCVYVANGHVYVGVHCLTFKFQIEAFDKEMERCRGADGVFVYRVSIGNCALDEQCLSVGQLRIWLPTNPAVYMHGGLPKHVNRTYTIEAFDKAVNGDTSPELFVKPLAQTYGRGGRDEKSSFPQEKKASDFDVPLPEPEPTCEPFLSPISGTHTARVKKDMKKMAQQLEDDGPQVVGPQLVRQTPVKWAIMPYEEEIVDADGTERTVTVLVLGLVFRGFFMPNDLEAVKAFGGKFRPGVGPDLLKEKSYYYEFDCSNLVFHPKPGFLTVQIGEVLLTLNESAMIVQSDVEDIGTGCDFITLVGHLKTHGKLVTPQTTVPLTSQVSGTLTDVKRGQRLSNSERRQRKAAANAAANAAASAASVN